MDLIKHICKWCSFRLAHDTHQMSTVAIGRVPGCCCHDDHMDGFSYAMLSSAADFYAEQLIQFLKTYTYTQIFHLQKGSSRKISCKKYILLLL